MMIRLIFSGLLLSFLAIHTNSQDTFVFGVTPNDPMVYCHVGDEFSAVELVSDSLSEVIYGYDIDLLKLIVFLTFANSFIDS